MATIYDRLGAEATFDLVVENFYLKVLADPLLAPMFVGIDMKRQKRMQHKFLAHVFGGREYSGRNMRAAHAKLHLTDAHFDAVIKHLKDTITELGVDAATINEIVDTAETTRNDVLAR